MIDPGFGFGKTVAQNYEMLRRLGTSFDLPILVGVSRKSMIGAITGRPASERVVPSAVLAVMAVARELHHSRTRRGRNSGCNGCLAGD